MSDADIANTYAKVYPKYVKHPSKHSMPNWIRSSRHRNSIIMCLAFIIGLIILVTGLIIIKKFFH